MTPGSPKMTKMKRIRIAISITETTKHLYYLLSNLRYRRLYQQLIVNGSKKNLQKNKVHMALSWSKARTSITHLTTKTKNHLSRKTSFKVLRQQKIKLSTLRLAN